MHRFSQRLLQATEVVWRSQTQARSARVWSNAYTRPVPTANILQLQSDRRTSRECIIRTSGWNVILLFEWKRNGCLLLTLGYHSLKKQLNLANYLPARAWLHHCSSEGLREVSPLASFSFRFPLDGWEGLKVYTLEKRCTLWKILRL